MPQSDLDVDIQALKDFASHLEALKGEITGAKKFGPSTLTSKSGQDETQVFGHFNDAQTLYLRYSAAHNGLGDVDTLAKAMDVLINAATSISKSYKDAANIEAVSAQQIKTLLGEQ